MNPDQPQPSAGPQKHSVRKIVLPSGRAIEVVRFDDSVNSLAHGLHICPACDSGLVQPLAWSERDDGRWELTLECPNCWWASEGTFDRDRVHEFEDRLDDGLADMLADLKRLAQANMAEEIDRFVEALESDQIVPEDF